MGKCANCGAELNPGWKFCIACGEAVPSTDQDATAGITSVGAVADPAAAAVTASAAPAPREPIPSAIRPDEPDDEPLPRKRMDAALIFGIAMSVGGVVLIILVAIALFSPRG